MARAIKSYDQIIGHKNIINWVKSRVEKDRVPNVMILHGQPGLGKTSVAKLLAIDVTTRFKPELREEYIHSVIERNVPVDSIKLFNMSEIQEKEEEIQKVKAELASLGFSRTKRKVLILDEAHNMSSKAQDAVLTDLESLAEGVYVFICTTEVGALRDALVSRSKATIQFNNLTEPECKKLIKEEIENRNLRFAMSSDLLYAFIASWAENQPRKVLNLIENFESGTEVSTEDLEVFISTSNSPKVVELIKYIYGSMALGINYITGLSIDNAFVNTLIEAAKVAVGGTSQLLSNADCRFIAAFMADKDIQRLLQFVAEVARSKYLTRRYVTAAFIRANVEYRRNETPIPATLSKSESMDFRVMSENVESVDVSTYTEKAPKCPTLEELFKNAEGVE